MNLKRLLATSQSFANLDERNPYAMCKENLLPAFNTQPRLRRAHSPQPALVQQELPTSAEPRQESRPAQKAAAQSREPVQQLELHEQPKQPVPVKKPGFWAVFRNLFGFRRRGARKLVQGEMELGNVKVVRNDLSDADLELVVPGKNGRPARPLYRSQHSLERNPLIRVRTRLFEAAER